MDVIYTSSAAQSVKPSKPNAPTSPPGGNIENRQPPAEPTKPGNGINSSGLSSLQNILSGFDENNSLTSEDQKKLSAKLAEAGFSGSGSIINLSA